MTRCQICGRHPAKSVTFRADQGFVLFRRVTTISGVFCRDHALEAYYTARGATLKGMWFSAGSLVMGTLGSLFDSAKLLDLPDEVKDEPWVPHIVACPHCKQKNVATAGPAKCESCGSQFTVASCVSCNAVHVVGKAESVGDVILTCRVCGRRTRGPEAVRNWAVLLLVRAIAEASATVATANGIAGAAERKTFLTVIGTVFGLDEMTAAYVGTYFDKCTAGNADGLLRVLKEECTDEYKRLALRVALSVAQADGFVDENETRILRNLAALLGLDPNRVYEGMDPGTVSTGIGEPWWEVLAVSSKASLDEVTFAYRKLAMQFHPDLWVRESESERQAADARMKRINGAFERANRDIQAREKRDAAAAKPAVQPAATKPAPAAAKPAVQPAATKPAETARGPAAEPSRKEHVAHTAPAATPYAPAAAKPAVQPAADEKEAEEEKSAKVASTIPSTKVPSRADGESAATSSALPFLVIAVSAMIFVAGTAIYLNQTGSTQQTLSQRPTEQTLAPPDPSPTEDPESPDRSQTFSQTPPITSDSNRRSATPAASDVAAGNSLRAVPAPNVTDNSDATKYYKQAEASAVRGAHATAVALLTKAIALQPRAAKLYTERGISNCRVGNRREAIWDLTTAIKIDPNSAKAYYSRGVVQVLRGEFDLAIQDFDAAIRLDPTYSVARAYRNFAVQKKREKEPSTFVLDSMEPDFRIRSPGDVGRDTTVQIGEGYYQKRAAAKQAAAKRGAGSP